MMSVLAGLITAVWQLVKKANKKRKKRRNTCAKIIEKNKEVERWSEDQPLVDIDYTETRWDKEVTSRGGHFCDGNCGCCLIKEYTRALDAGDTVKAEKIKSGEYTLPMETSSDVEPSVKLSEKDIKRLNRIQKKLQEETTVTQRPMQHTKTDATYKQRKGRRPLPLAAESKISSKKYKGKDLSPSKINAKCCSNETCGCHLVQEYTRALNEDNKELLNKIVKGMHTDTEWTKNNSRLSKDDKTNRNNCPESVNKKDIRVRNVNKQDECSSNVIIEAQCSDTTEKQLSDDNVFSSEQMNTSEPCLANNDGSENQTTDTVDDSIEVLKLCAESENTCVPVQNKESSDTVLNTVSASSNDIDNHKHDLNTSFHHNIPHYYEHNENTINHMADSKKSRKKKKKKTTSKKIKMVKVNKLTSSVSDGLRVKRYNSLVEEESDGSFTENNVFM